MDGNWVIEQLKNLPSEYGLNIKGDKAFIRCPYHSNNGHLERTPSCIINIESSLHHKTGSIYCFGCSIHKTWNEFASDMGLTKVDEEEEKYSIGSLSQKDKEELFGTKSVKEKYMVSVDWDINDSWRGINGKLLNKLGGQLTSDTYMTDTQLYLPVNVNKKKVGGIYCKINRKSKKEMGYINESGNWVLHKGLFPFDYSNKMLNRLRKDKKNSILFLVEGPRDALNLVQNGIPAMAILGSKNWSKQKKEIISFLNLDEIVLAFDPDRAGEQAYENVKRDLENMYPLSKLAMEQGKDCADLTPKQCNTIKRKLGI